MGNLTCIPPLYRERGHVELDLRNIKTALGLETLSCKTPVMAQKEIWVYLLLADRMPRELSFKPAFQLWIAWL